MAGASNQLDGDLKAVNAGTIHIGAPAASTLLRTAPAAQTQTSVDGSISADATSKIIFNNASVEVSKGNSVSIEGELTSTNGQLVLNDVEEGTVQIATLTQGSTLDAVASVASTTSLAATSMPSATPSPSRTVQKARPLS